MEEKYHRWKSALESKALKINVNKTKAMKVGVKSSKNVVSAIDPRASCRKRVIRNSIECLKCDYWVHKRFCLHCNDLPYVVFVFLPSSSTKKSVGLISVIGVGIKTVLLKTKRSI